MIEISEERKLKMSISCDCSGRTDNIDVDGVYDFDGENEDLNAELDLDDKSKIQKAVGRRTQQAVQSHMCNYCSYTTPKRYENLIFHR